VRGKKSVCVCACACACVCVLAKMCKCLRKCIQMYTNVYVCDFVKLFTNMKR